MKKNLNKLATYLKKSSKKVFSKKVLFIVVLPISLILLLYIFRSLIFAAWVNGKPVYRYSLTRELEKQGGKQVLDGLIEKSLVASEAKKANIAVSQDDIDLEIKNIEQTIASQGISLDDALNLRGMTRKDLDNQIRTQKTVEKILSEKVVITDVEIKEYFNSNKSLFGQNPVFDTVKEQVKTQIFQQKLSEEYSLWITDLKTKAKILYFISL